MECIESKIYGNKGVEEMRWIHICMNCELSKEGKLDWSHGVHFPIALRRSCESADVRKLVSERISRFSRLVGSDKWCGTFLVVFYVNVGYYTQGSENLTGLPGHRPATFS
jgi:hypothetical protein